MHLKTRLALPDNLSLVSTQSKLESDTSQGWFTTPIKLRFLYFLFMNVKKKTMKKELYKLGSLHSLCHEW